MSQPKRHKFRRRLICKDGRTFEIKSLSQADARYCITVSEHGVLQCSCPAMTFRPGILCTHAKRALTWLERHEKASYQQDNLAIEPPDYFGYADYFDEVESRPMP